MWTCFTKSGLCSSFHFQTELLRTILQKKNIGPCISNAITPEFPSAKKTPSCNPGHKGHFGKFPNTFPQDPHLKKKKKKTSESLTY